MDLSEIGSEVYGNRSRSCPVTGLGTGSVECQKIGIIYRKYSTMKEMEQ
jgi:hypothetical protein